jgi:hypothetical protein
VELDPDAPADRFERSTIVTNMIANVKRADSRWFRRGPGHPGAGDARIERPGAVHRVSLYSPRSYVSPLGGLGHLGIEGAAKGLSPAEQEKVEQQAVQLREKTAEAKTVAMRTYPALIKKCLDHHPTVIATTTTPAAKLLKEATGSIPIEMVALGDPLGTSLVDSLSRPSKMMVPQTAVKRLEIPTDLMPGIKHVLVL